MSKNKTKSTTNSIAFVFVNPRSDCGEFAPEAGRITLTVDSGAEAALEVVDSPDFQDALEKFLADQFCAEGGKVVTVEVANLLAEVE